MAAVAVERPSQEAEIVGSLQAAVMAADQPAVSELLRAHRKVVTAAGAVGPDGQTAVWSCINHRRDWEVTLGEFQAGMQVVSPSPQCPPNRHRTAATPTAALRADPLHPGTAKAPKLKIFQALCRAGCDVDYCMPGTQPPIHLALMFEADGAADLGSPALEALLAAGASVAARDSRRTSDSPAGRTALQYADEVTAGMIRKPQLDMVRDVENDLKQRCAALAARQRLAWAKVAGLPEVVAEAVGAGMHRVDSFEAGVGLVGLVKQTVKEEATPRSSAVGVLLPGSVIRVLEVGEFKGRVRLRLALEAEPDGAEAADRWVEGWIFAVGFDGLPQVRRADGTDTSRLLGRHWERLAAPAVVLRERYTEQRPKR